MPKADALTRVTGVVALSYLAILPVAGYFVYKKLQELREEVDEVWKEVGYEPDPRPPNIFRKYLFKEDAK